MAGCSMYHCSAVPSFLLRTLSAMAVRRRGHGRETQCTYEPHASRQAFNACHGPTAIPCRPAGTVV